VGLDDSGLRGRVCALTEPIRKWTGAPCSSKRTWAEKDGRSPTIAFAVRFRNVMVGVAHRIRPTNSVPEGRLRIMLVQISFVVIDRERKCPVWIGMEIRVERLCPSASTAANPISFAAFSSTHSVSCAFQELVRPLIWTALAENSPGRESWGEIR
jgi:hypothetical protein